MRNTTNKFKDVINLHTLERFEEVTQEIAEELKQSRLFRKLTDKERDSKKKERSEWND